VIDSAASPRTRAVRSRLNGAQLPPVAIAVATRATSRFERMVKKLR
jgi:hypothetical protein